MKIKTLFAGALLLSLLFISSCSHRIVGTWNVNRYETNAPNQPGVSLLNIGTFTFSKNNTGTKNLQYSVLNITRDDVVPFAWNWENDKYVTLTGDESDFAKTWIIMENSNKKQVWKSTDGSNTIQILELEKMKKKKK